MNPAVKMARILETVSDQETIDTLRLLNGLQPEAVKPAKEPAEAWTISFSNVREHPADLYHQLPLASIPTTDWQQLRQLRDTLWDAQEDDTRGGTPFSLIGLTGLSSPAERWAVAAGLWASHREWSGCRVLLIDADPSCAPSLEAAILSPSPGLIDVATRTATLSSALHRIQGTQLYLMGPGMADMTSLDQIDFRATRPLFAELRRHFDFVFLNLPNHEGASDLAAWARHTDGTLLICRRERDSYQHWESLLSCIPPAKALGWVVL
jgi:hypothetical protein